MRDEFGTEGPTREQREAAALAKHGDGMSPTARAELAREIGEMIDRAQHSIEVAVDHQVISFSYPGDPQTRAVSGPGRTITIKLDGGHDSGMIGTVPAGTFPEPVAAAVSDRLGPRPIPTSEATAAAVAATKGERGQDGD